MYLRQNIPRLILDAGKLGNLQDIVRLTPALFSRIVDEHRIRLIPPLGARGSIWVRSYDVFVLPYPRKSFVALHAQVVVFFAQTEFVSCPGDYALGALLWREETVDHFGYICWARRGPDCDGEGTEAVAHKLPGVRPLYKVEWALFGWPE